VWNDYGEVIGYNGYGYSYTDHSGAAIEIHGGGEQAYQQIYAVDPYNSAPKSAVYNQNTGNASLAFDFSIDYRRANGGLLGTDLVTMADPNNGYAVYGGIEAWDIKNRVTNYGWINGNTPVVMYDPWSYDSHSILAQDVKFHIDEYGFHFPNDEIAVFEYVTGARSEARAWEIQSKRVGDGTGRWYTGNQRVVVFSAYDGSRSEAYAWEISAKRAGADGTGIWYTGEERVRVYNYNTGRASYAYAWELSGKAAGDNHGVFRTEYQSIPVKNLVTGKTYYVPAAQAETAKSNERVRYNNYVASLKPKQSTSTVAVVQASDGSLYQYNTNTGEVFGPPLPSWYGAVIRPPTNEERIRYYISDIMPLVPIVSTINNIAIGINGNDLMGRGYNKGQQARAGQNAMFDVGFAFVGGMGSTYGKAAANYMDDVARGVGKVGVPNTPNQQAVIDLAKEAKKAGGVTAKDANTLMQWADEYNIYNHGPEIHPNRPGAASNILHFHIGKQGHIPIVD
jgi:hypothetical protein